MSTPSTGDDLLGLVRKSGLVEPQRLDGCVRRFGNDPASVRAKTLARYLGRHGLLTRLQAQQLLRGKYRGFTLGGYLLLERLGRDRVSSVFLCRRLPEGRRVAIKLIPVRRSADGSALVRFYRETTGATAPDHPSLVRTLDLAQEGRLLLLAREYVDGGSLQEVVQASGPLGVARAAHYIGQAAAALHQLHQLGFIHHDVNPGTLLIDRQGAVRILDPGLARFWYEHRDLLPHQGEKTAVLGSADYLAPEQALAGPAVDPRADLYSLGATLYFLLTGRPPFDEENVLRKLLFHQVKEPRPIHELRPEVPEALVAVVARMMAKDPAQRYADAGAVAEALAPYAVAPIPLPAEGEMPRLCRAARYDVPPDPEPVPPPPAAPDRPADLGVPEPEPVAESLPAPEFPVGPAVSGQEQDGGVLADVGEPNLPFSPDVPEPTTAALTFEFRDSRFELQHPAEDGPGAESDGPRSEGASPGPPPDSMPAPAGDARSDAGETDPAAGKEVRAATRRRRTRLRPGPDDAVPAPRPPSPETDSGEAPPAGKRPSAPDKRPGKAQAARAARTSPRPVPRPRATEPEPERPAPHAGGWTYDTPAAPAPRPAPRPTQPERSVMLPRLVLGFVAVCGVAIGIVALANGGKKDEAPIEISGEQLLREFAENEVIANQKYYRKVVEVRGVVHDYTDEKLALHVSRLNPGMIYCRLTEKDMAEVSSFKKGETLVVKGICDGVTTSVRGVAIRDCQFSR